jgi:hypothetical protein
MVALPILIVTSYILYERRELVLNMMSRLITDGPAVVVLGVERKHFAPAPQPKSEATNESVSNE